MNNNKISASALEAQCKGVFLKTSYITIGSEELSMLPVFANRPAPAPMPVLAVQHSSSFREQL